MKISQKELDFKLEKHALWLGDEGGARLVLPNADLTEADLTRADLRKAVLSGADLCEAVLSGADLTDAKGI